jgi:hypothetical protein
MARRPLPPRGSASAPPEMTILATMADADLFAPWFAHRPSWDAWRAFLCALFALPMTADQLATYRQCTSRASAPTVPAREAWLVCGRRSGKSFIVALCAVFLAVVHDWRRHLAPGERAIIMVVSVDRKSSRSIIRGCRRAWCRPLQSRCAMRRLLSGMRGT